ncbi:unnamed protein product [Phytophthora lilii]|uniref:Unnamed protein product n=1 Tax=Phytophthora lilii TaxID=2077276 RepID=A0A9W6U0L6_9STRA|nr:unnamed protein product [Phytophthora lilii]
MVQTIVRLKKLGTDDDVAIMANPELNNSPQKWRVYLQFRADSSAVLLTSTSLRRNGRQNVALDFRALRTPHVDRLLESVADSTLCQVQCRRNINDRGQSRSPWTTDPVMCLSSCGGSAAPVPHQAFNALAAGPASIIGGH